MWHGIEAVKPGRPISDIGRAIEDHAKAHRYGVIRAFIGHGIGEQFHADIQVLHYYDSRASMIMRPGMTFTIEPMISLGTWQHKMWDDDWTAVTADGKRTAQFEHTLVVTDDGCRRAHRRARRGVAGRPVGSVTAGDGAAVAAAGVVGARCVLGACGGVRRLGRRRRRVTVTDAWARTTPPGTHGRRRVPRRSTSDTDDALVGAAVDPSIAARRAAHDDDDDAGGRRRWSALDAARRAGRRRARARPARRPRHARRPRRAAGRRARRSS